MVDAENRPRSCPYPTGSVLEPGRPSALSRASRSRAWWRPHLPPRAPASCCASRCSTSRIAYPTPRRWPVPAASRRGHGSGTSLLRVDPRKHWLGVNYAIEGTFTQGTEPGQVISTRSWPTIQGRPSPRALQGNLAEEGHRVGVRQRASPCFPFSFAIFCSALSRIAFLRSSLERSLASSSSARSDIRNASSF